MAMVCVAAKTRSMGQGKGKEKQDFCSCPKYLVPSWPLPAPTQKAWSLLPFPGLEHGYLSCSPVLHRCWRRSCLLVWGWPVSLEHLRRMWTWPSKYLLKMHKVQLIFGHLTKCRWIFHGGSKRDTSNIAAPALMSDFKSVTKSWKGATAFQVCQRFLLTLKDNIFSGLVLKTAEVFWLSSSNCSLPLSAPLPQRQPLQHMEQNLAWGRHSTWKISTQTVKVWPSYKQLEAASCIGGIQQLPNRRCYKLHQ